MTTPHRAAKRRRWMLRVPPSAEWLFSLGLIALDAFILNAIFLWVFALWLAHNPNQELYLASYYHVRMGLFGMFLVFGTIFDIYRLRSFLAASDILSHTTATLLSTFLAFNILVFLWRPLAYLVHTFPRPIILLSTGLSILAIFLVRVLLARVFKPQPLLRRALIVGDEAEGKRILKHFHSRGGVRFRLMGIHPAERIDAVASEVIFHQIHEVIITDPKVSLDVFWARIFWMRKEEPHAFNVRLVNDPSQATGNIGLSSLEDFPMTTIPALPLSRWQRVIKRGFDVAFALFALAITSPVMAAAALLVHLDSPGPIFFKQRRVGRYGKEYDLIKFRSMRVGAEAQTGPKIATADDPRVTRVGRYLRRFGIDELPQFFHVLTGDMSVVGPRPERPFFVSKHLEFQGRRLSVRPGVTGLAAVNARYYLRLVDKVLYDYYYLDHYHLILDIKIIFQTVWVLLFESDKALEDVHHPKDRMEPPPAEEPLPTSRKDNP
ncbi:MAG: Bacterial sugar transferase [Candidatus Ozemobacter sibiricus]|uniref:Bacterial sugar transferase n=1 Tax=Candidatus Ozemobacter sibiricus TaxID=2268124 RepID=A0A367ZS20_9BACT|nr:MAG: Bacterial sugar transferase [Candidatus Ozemobacter sibiricus]